MIESWKEANRQDVLVAGSNDWLIDMPRYMLATFADCDNRNVPVIIVNKTYKVKGWSDTDRGDAFVKVLLAVA